MKKILFGLLGLVILTVGALSYVGVVPYISPLITKPRNLGIKADPALVTAFNTTHDLKVELPGGVVPDDREPIYSGSKELNIDISNEEITSILAYWKNQDHQTPIRDVQAKINNDGTGEVSGILELSTAISMAKQLGYSDNDIEKGKSYVSFIAGDLPFYLKGTGEVKNNQVSIDPSEIIIGRVSLPSSLAGPVAKASADAIERRINQIPGTDVQELSLKNNGVHFMGTIPDTVK